MKARRGILSHLIPLLSLALAIAVLTGNVLSRGDDERLVLIEAKKDLPSDFLVSSGMRVVKDLGSAALAVAREDDLARLAAMGFSCFLLDEDPRAKEYYLVFLRPGLESSLLAPYGKLLTTIGRIAVVESSRARIMGALGMGVEIERLDMEPVRPSFDFPESPPVLEWNGLIQSMADSISQSSIEGFVDDLVAFGTRRSDSDGGIQAQNYLRNYFESLGIDSVYLHDFDQNADNVIAVIPGLLYPNQIYVIGAHYDSYAYTPGNEPGADDNASGTACVMEVARIMSRFFYERTIIFAGWASEEFGLIGSSYWASEAAARGDSILGYINLDMEGYVESGDVVNLDIISNSPSTPLRDLAFQVASDYVPDLSLVDGYLFGGSSDHASFWDAGYKAIFFFEDSDDYSPYIHTPNDVVGLSLNNFPFCTDICRVAVAWMATAASPFSVAIFHTPLASTENTVDPYPVTARIVGAAPLLPDSVLVHYATGGQFSEVPMEESSPDVYEGLIPAQPNGTVVSYYISAVDSAGNRNTDPYGAPGETHRFLVQRVDFADISESSGTDDSGFGEGVAWGDYNGDGLEDLFVSNFAGPDRLYRNDGGGIFTEVGAQAGVADTRTSFGASWGDYDNDGDLDLYVAVRYDPNILYRNEGDGTFTDAAAIAGAAGEETDYSQSAAWADYDNDGLLDLYVANRFAANHLYRNLGNGTFADMAEEAGVAGTAPCVTAVWGDYDGDGLADLLVTRTGSMSCLLFHNEGDGTFSEVAESHGLAAASDWAGADWGDCDNDGDLDLYIACASCRDVLYRNEGDGSFTDVSEEAGITGRANTKSPSFADFDNDGLLDIHVSSGTGNLLYLNLGDGSFVELGGIAELADSGPGEGSATADIDNDGLPDVYTANAQYVPNALFMNLNPGNSYLVLKLTGTKSNRASIGARITLYAGDLSLTREVRSGSGLYSQESLPVEFGLAAAVTADSIVVTWPSGRSRTLRDVAANQHLTVSEPPRHPAHREAVSVR